MKLRIVALVLLAGAWLSLAGCKSSPTPTPVSSPIDRPPTPTFSASPLDSPLSAPSSSDTDSFVDGDKFELERPLSAGATVVRGKGEPLIQIMIVDVTDVGQVLGQGAVDEQGRFEINLDAPLQAKHRVGISFNIEGLELRCTRCQDIPLVGLIADSARVEP